MKNYLKVILPVLAFTMASAGAISTNSAKEKGTNEKAVIEGYIQNPTKSICLPTEVQCTPVNTGENCMSSELTPRRVWLKNEAHACSVNLFKVI